MDTIILLKIAQDHRLHIRRKNIGEHRFHKFFCKEGLKQRNFRVVFIFEPL